jgi:hypothetical protein
LNRYGLTNKYEELFYLLTNWNLQSYCKNLIHKFPLIHLSYDALLRMPCVVLVITWSLLAKLNSWRWKVKLSLCLTKHHAMKTYWGMEVQLHAFLTSALDGSEWSASRPDRFTPRKRVPGTHWTGGWVGPRAVLDAVMKKKILSPRRVSNPRTPIVQPAAQRYTTALTWLLSLIHMLLYYAQAY